MRLGDVNSSLGLKIAAARLLPHGFGLRHASYPRRDARGDSLAVSHLTGSRKVQDLDKCAAVVRGAAMAKIVPGSLPY